MVELCGRRYGADELAEYFGDSSCVAGIRRFELRDGRAEGCRITEVRTGGGLTFEVNESRGLDLGRVSLNGVPVSYSSYNGEVNPVWYETFGDGWLRSFGGGLLVTGGLRSTGTPGEDGGEVLPLHGRISNIPAERVCVDERVDADGARVFSVSGAVRESKALDHDLVLRRTVSAREGERSLYIDDVIENQGFSDQELMLLYHINVGHPIVDAGSRLLTHSASVEPRDADAAAQEEPYDEYVAPTPGYKDIVYYHRLKPTNEAAGSKVTAAIVNERVGMGIALEFDREELDCFTQWKFLGQGNYVAGIEPGNAFVSGRAVERAAGRVKVLPARSSKHVGIKVTVLDGADEINRYKNENGFAV